MSTKSIFLKGALILGISNVLVKLIGAFYTIPLARLIGPEGMGLYNCAYQIYLWLFIISTTGFPIAISKLVSENIALGEMAQAHKIFKTSLVILIIIGIFSFVLLYLSAQILVNSIIGTSKAYLCLIAISPCLLFVSIMSAYRGYFQGRHNMLPTAVSQLLEAIIKAILGLTFAYYLREKGIEYSSAGAVLGVSIGGFGGMVLLLTIYHYHKSRNVEYFKLKLINNYTQEKTKDIAYKLFKIAFPITIGASVFTISGIIDLMMIMRRLQEIGFSEDYALKQYGYLTGYAYKVFNLPTTIIIALAVSIVPAVSSIYARRNVNYIKRIVYMGLKCALMFSIPAAVGIAILSKGILKLLFNDFNASRILTLLCFAVVFVSAVQVSGAILQGIGRVMLPVKNLFIGAVIKAFMNHLLLGIPSINILGAAISTSVCYMVVTMLNFIDIKKILGVRYNLNDMFIKPLIAATGMGIIILYLYNSTYILWNNNGISTLLSVLAGVVVYSLLIIFIGGLNREDIEILPCGEKISYLLLRLKILK